MFGHFKESKASAHIMVNCKDKHHEHIFPFHPSFPEFLLLITMSHDMKYHLVSWGHLSQLYRPLGSYASSACSAEAEWEKEKVLTLYKHCRSIPKTLVCYQHCFVQKFGLAPYYEENYLHPSQTNTVVLVRSLPVGQRKLFLH